MPSTTPACTQPTSALADAITAHAAAARHTTRTDLPNGHRLALRSRSNGDLSASVFAPSPAGPARIVLASFKGALAGDVPARVLSAAIRCAPPRPDLADAFPDPVITAKAMTLGQPHTEPGTPGLLVTYGPAQLWLERRALSVVLGRAGSMRITLEGPWDHQAAGQLADSMLREATWLDQLPPADVSAALPAWASVHEDGWHPAATTVFLPALPGDDELGRAHSRRYRALADQVEADHPDWRVQKLVSNEFAIVALRITRADAEVPPLYGYVVPAKGYESPGGGSRTFVTEYRPIPTRPAA
ncbi:hypothetical protein [Streptomyces sp. NEAU-S7GS2]|uniref:hypothetical protein n=1 Tax=Streptomyces sp. NEAU-S7GS2 TaxID=2202000 RepID=UPI000D6F22CA|nr:hypothetical protein [Streptomyces sp. NEAU-S7GS2]AWN24774.1 hypothetical protein DKG71_00010 [Streptomyces sp. NEAU-S7GS2]